jgi:hypothetical protein
LRCVHSLSANIGKDCAIEKLAHMNATRRHKNTSATDAVDLLVIAMSVPIAALTVITSAIRTRPNVFRMEISTQESQRAVDLTDNPESSLVEPKYC